jgi:hypothetical protein
MSDTPRAHFLDHLQAFVLFHLGSDAVVRVETSDEGLDVFLEHNRIRPVRFSVNRGQLKEMQQDPLRLEDFLLDLLTANRRS